MSGDPGKGAPEGFPPVDRMPRQVFLAIGVILFLLLVVRLALSESETTVYVLSQDVAESTALTPAMLVAKQVRTADAPVGVVLLPEEVQGKYARSTLYAGQPVPVAALHDAPGPKRLPGGAIQKDETLFPVPVPPQRGPVVGPMLNPGDYVDLVWLTPEPITSRIVLTKARVAYIHPGDPALAYIVVTRQQFVELTYISTRGSLFVLPLTPDTTPSEDQLLFVPSQRGLATPTPRPSLLPLPLTTAAPTRSPQP